MQNDDKEQELQTGTAAGRRQPVGGRVLMAVTIALGVFLLFNFRLFGRGANGGSILYILVFFGSLLLLALTLARLLFREQKGLQGTRRRIRLPEFLIALAVLPLVWHLGCEFIVSHNPMQIAPVHHLMSIGISAVLFAVLFLLFHSLIAAAVFGCVFYFAFAAAQYYTIAFRSIPVMFSDLLDIGAAATVVGNYTFQPTLQLIVVAILYFVVAVNLGMDGDRTPSDTLKMNLLGRVSAVVIALGLVFGIGASEAYTRSVGTLFHVLHSYYTIGSQLCFIQSIKNAQIKAPEGYSPELVEGLADEYLEKARAYNAALPEEDRPNVIAIMDESFSDLDVTGKHQLKKRNMPNLTALKENAIKGRVMVSTYGGGTGRSEFEFNTGLSMHLFDESASPYSLFGQRMKYALASQLKEQGYTTVSLHPYIPSNYNRPRTYEAMGFDTFYSQEDFENPTYIRSYISDATVFDRITSIVDETEEPVFAFTVTMQNHGGYGTEGFQSTVRLKGRWKEAQEFATLIKESDAALGALIEHYRNSDEKTIIVMFGDHYPTIKGKFYRKYNGFTKDSEDITEGQQYYQTEYFIWANYDIEAEENHLTSLNYLGYDLLRLAGSRLTPFQLYLADLQKQIPAFSRRLWYGTDGRYHEFGTDPAVDERIRQYDCIEYNELIDKGNRCDRFFALPS